MNEIGIKEVLEVRGLMERRRDCLSGLNRSSQGQRRSARTIQALAPTDMTHWAHHSAGSTLAPPSTLFKMPLQAEGHRRQHVQHVG